MNTKRKLTRQQLNLNKNPTKSRSLNRTTKNKKIDLSKTTRAESD